MRLWLLILVSAASAARAGPRAKDVSRPARIGEEIRAVDPADLGREVPETVMPDIPEGAIDLRLQGNLTEAPPSLAGLPAVIERPGAAVPTVYRPGAPANDRSRDRSRDEAASESWLRSTFDLSDDKLVDSYLQLDAKRRETLRAMALQEFRKRDAEALHDPALAGAERVAAAIRRAFPKSDDVVVAVGRSLLLPVKMAAMQDDHPERFRSLALSHSRNQQGEIVHPVPTQSQLQGFRAYMTSLGLDPASLKGRRGRLIFADYVGSGNLMKDLVWGYMAWAEEVGMVSEVAIKVWVAYATSNTNIYPGSFLPVRAKKLRVDEEVLKALKASLFSGVFGAPNPQKLWDVRDPRREINPRREALGRFTLVDFLARLGTPDPAPRSIFASARALVLRAVSAWTGPKNIK